MQLIVGRVVRPHGIRGELVVEVRTDAPQERFAVGSVLNTDTTGVRPHPGVAGPSQGGPAAPGVAVLPGAAVAGVPPGATAVAVPATVTITASRPHQDRYLLCFDGVADRDAAEVLRGVLLCVDSGDVAAVADPDEFHDFELIGLAAVDAAGQPIGEVVRIDHAPAADLLVVRRADGRTALVPFVSAIVPEIDVPGGRIVVTPPEGLFDL